MLKNIITFIKNIFIQKMYLYVECKIVNREAKYVIYAKLHWWNKWHPYIYKELTFDELSRILDSFVLMEEDVDLAFKRVLK